MKEAIWEAIKEPLRILVLAIIPVLLVSLEKLSVEWAAVLILVLKFIDQVLHEIGKEEEKDNLVKGLVRF